MLPFFVGLCLVSLVPPNVDVAAAANEPIEAMLKRCRLIGETICLPIILNQPDWNAYYRQPGYVINARQSHDDSLRIAVQQRQLEQRFIIARKRDAAKFDPLIHPFIWYLQPDAASPQNCANMPIALTRSHRIRIGSQDSPCSQCTWIEYLLEPRTAWSFGSYGIGFE